MIYPVKNKKYVKLVLIVVVAVTAVSIVTLVTISPMWTVSSMSQANATSQSTQLTDISTTVQTGNEASSRNNTSCVNDPTCNDKLIYFVGSNVKPKDVLYDYSYDGIDRDNTVVSIKGQTFYQMTLQNTIHNLKKGTSVSFQNVTFAFPEGVMITPGADLLVVNVHFLDGFQEIYGEHQVNPDGSTNYGGIAIPTPYGPHYAVNSVTVLGNHIKPQAGITIYHDSIKLLVSK